MSRMISWCFVAKPALQSAGRWIHLHAFVQSSVVAGLLLLTSSNTAAAAQLDWGAKVAEYVVVDQDLRAALAEISSHLGVPAHISDEVKGRIHEKLPALPAKALLQELSGRYGITWYFDGSGLYFSALKESTSQILSIGQVSFPFLQRQLEELGVLDERFELRFSEAGRIVYASGPPRYLELVRQGLEAANAQSVARTQPKNINVIYGYGGSH